MLNEVPQHKEMITLRIKVSVDNPEAVGECSDI